MRLNHICLRAIFDELSLPAKLFLDSALHCGPQSPWSQSLRTWKSLVLVCRNWHAAATPYLYRNVVLRRTGQVPALVKTLKDNEDFDSMIRYLTISCYVPDEWDEVMNDNVAYLLSKCHNIRSLYLLSFFTQWLHALTPDGTRRFKIPNEILSSASSIEILCYGYEHPEYFFSGKEYTVGPAGMTAEQADVNYYHVFSSLPNVRSLRILMDPHISTSFKWRPFVVSFKKQHLAQIRSDPIKFGTRRYLRDLDDKLETYRVDLALWSTIHFQLPSLLIREIGRDFDNIHIVMDTLLRNRSILGPNTWVDMWVSDMTLFEDGVHSPFDRRRRYRLLDNRLRSLGGLPYVFPPEKSRTRRHENYIYTHDIFGMRFTRTAKRISYIEEPWGKIYETPESEVSTDSDDIIGTSLLVMFQTSSFM